MGNGQKDFSNEPDTRLSCGDKIIRRRVNKKFGIDKKTFRNTTPDRQYTYWINGIRCYQAMNKNWIIADPPGNPSSFYVTPSNEIFKSFPKALTSIHYVPENDKDALRIGIIIAGEDSSKEAHIITKNNIIIEGIPESVLSGVNTAPAVTGKGDSFTVTVYSYISRNNINHFVHAYHAVWQHIITIRGYTYTDTINNISLDF